MSQYIFNRGLLIPKWTTPPGKEKEEYKTERIFWEDLISNNSLSELSKIRLEKFKLLEWVPQSPGCYHTEDAKWSRERAENFVNRDSDGYTIYDPYGKLQMIRGGVGCLRLASKMINGINVKFLCATSSGVAHRGILVSLKSELYAQVAQTIAKSGAILCDLDGTLKVWPESDEIPFHRQLGVPKIYVDVEEIHIRDAHNFRRERLDVTASVTFSGKYKNCTV